MFLLTGKLTGILTGKLIGKLTGKLTSMLTGKLKGKSQASLQTHCKDLRRYYISTTTYMLYSVFDYYIYTSNRYWYLLYFTTTTLQRNVVFSMTFLIYFVVAANCRYNYNNL